MKRVALGTAIALATLLLAAMLWQLRGAVLLFVVSLAAAAAMRPFVDGIEARGIPRNLALAIVYALGMLVVAAFGLLVARAVMDELGRALELLGAGYDRWRGRAAGVHPVPDLLLRRLPPASALLGAVSAGKPEVLAREVLGLTLGLIDVVGRFVIVVALSAYWSASRDSFERLWLSLIPASRRGRARDVWRHVDAGVGTHMRSEIGQSLLTVLVLTGVFHAAGLPVPILPALAAGLLRLVPLVGLPFAVLVAFMVGALVRIEIGLLAAAATAALIFFLSEWQRRMVAGRFGSHRRLSGTLVVLMVVALADAYGVLGILLAAPVAAAVQIFLERMLATQPGRARRVERLSDVEGRLARLRHAVPRLPEPQSSEVANLVQRLEQAVIEARDLPGMAPPAGRRGGAAWELSPSTPMIGDRPPPAA